MTSFGFVVLMLATCWLLGWPLRRLLPGKERWLAAPVLGFAVFSLGATLLYRAGMAPGTAAGGLLILGLGACGAEPWLRPAQPGWRLPAEARNTLLLAGAVLLVCLAPGWLGGEQFRVFQGNDQDQLNYVAFSSAYRSHGYTDLMAMTPEAMAANNYLFGARKMLLSRPAICIALAALAELYGQMTPDLVAAWMAGLQTLSFFAACYLLRGVVGVSPLPAAITATALTLGFFIQYVIDINAWSELAGLPVGMTAGGALLLLTAPDDSTDWPRLRLTLLLGLLLATLLYLYPELLLEYGPAAMLMLLAGQHGVGWRGRLHALRYPLLAGAGAVLACLPMWQGTLGTMLVQQQNAMTHNLPWWRHFQAYLFGRDLDYFATSSPDLGSIDLLYALISLPIDFSAGLLGLHFLLPWAGLAMWLRLGWKLALAMFMVLLVLAAARALREILRASDAASAERRWRGFAAMALAAAALPVLILAMGRYWPAGKAWSMAAPLLLLLLASPLFRRRPADRDGAITLLYLATHIALGLWRPIAATDPDGILYPAPYPAVPERARKTEFNWNLARFRPDLKQCHGVLLDLTSPALERYAQVNLTELGVPWSSLSPLNTDYFEGESLGLKPPLPDADCVMTTQLRVWGANQRVIWLGRNRTLSDFLAGQAPSLDLVTAGLPVPGLYAPEPYAGGLLRWTDGNTRIHLPGGLVRRLDIDLWPVRLPGTTLRIEVNGVILFDGTLPDGEWRRSFVLSPEPANRTTEILIHSITFRPPADPRTLGVALHHLALGH